MEYCIRSDRFVVLMCSCNCLFPCVPTQSTSHNCALALLIKLMINSDNTSEPLIMNASGSVTNTRYQCIHIRNHACMHITGMKTICTYIYTYTSIRCVCTQLYSETSLNKPSKLRTQLEKPSELRTQLGKPR